LSYGYKQSQARIGLKVKARQRPVKAQQKRSDDGYVNGQNINNQQHENPLLTTHFPTKLELITKSLNAGLENTNLGDRALDY
jgi:hypothetical protein